MIKVDDAGAPDPTFGTNGMTQTSFPTASADIAKLLAQPDGKYVAAGTGVLNASPYPAAIALARYEANGSLDPTFGSGGTALVEIIDGNTDISANDAVLRSDGKIVTAGNVLARFNPDGSIDTAFGSNGVYVLGYLAQALLQTPLGNLLLVGVSAGQYLLVERRNADGVVDVSFGTGGQVVTSLGGVGAFGLTGLLAPDTKIIAGGAAFTAVGQARFGVIRLLADGSFDTTFSDDGTQTIDMGAGFNPVTALARQPNGKLLLVGTANASGNNADLGLVRLNADGSLDTGFGNQGRVIEAGPAPYNNATWNTTAVAADGRLITGGNWADTSLPAPPQQLLIGRYLLYGLESLTVRVDDGPPFAATVGELGNWWATVTGVRSGSVITATDVSTEGQTAIVRYRLPSGRGAARVGAGATCDVAVHGRRQPAGRDPGGFRAFCGRRHIPAGSTHLGELDGGRVPSLRRQQMITAVSIGMASARVAHGVPSQLLQRCRPEEVDDRTWRRSAGIGTSLTQRPRPDRTLAFGEYCAGRRRS